MRGSLDEYEWVESLMSVNECILVIHYYGRLFLRMDNLLESQQPTVVVSSALFQKRKIQIIFLKFKPVIPKI